MAPTIKQIATQVVQHARDGLRNLQPFEDSVTFAEALIGEHLPPAWIQFYRNATEGHADYASIDNARRVAEAALNRANERIRELEEARAEDQQYICNLEGVAPKRWRVKRRAA